MDIDDRALVLHNHASSGKGHVEVSQSILEEVKGQRRGQVNGVPGGRSRKQGDSVKEILQDGRRSVSLTSTFSGGENTSTTGGSLHGERVEETSSGSELISFSRKEGRRRTILPIPPEIQQGAPQGHPTQQLLSPAPSPPTTSPSSSLSPWLEKTIG